MTETARVSLQRCLTCWQPVAVGCHCAPGIRSSQRAPNCHPHAFVGTAGHVPWLPFLSGNSCLETSRQFFLFFIPDPPGPLCSHLQAGADGGRGKISPGVWVPASSLASLSPKSCLHPASSKLCYFHFCRTLAFAWNVNSSLPRQTADTSVPTSRKRWGLHYICPLGFPLKPAQ